MNWRVAFAVVAAAAVAALPWRVESQPRQLKVGFVSTLSGGRSSFGARMFWTPSNWPCGTWAAAWVAFPWKWWWRTTS
jgi:hypothetical protein